MASPISLLGRLTPEEHAIEERLRTLAVCVTAAGVISYGLYVLRSILVPLVLAVALTYLLQPLIDVLSLRPLHCCGATLCARTPEQLRKVAARLQAQRLDRSRPLWECWVVEGLEGGAVGDENLNPSLAKAGTKTVASPWDPKS